MENATDAKAAMISNTNRKEVVDGNTNGLNRIVGGVPETGSDVSTLMQRPSGRDRETAVLWTVHAAAHHRRL
jgi:hypothetical protein